MVREKLMAQAVLSLDSAISPEATLERRGRIKQFTRPRERLAALVIHNITVAQPAMVARLLGIELSDDIGPLEYIASNAVSAVYKKSEAEVIKYAGGSIFLSAPEKLKLIDRKSAEYEAMAAHLGELTLPQQMSVGRHPRFAGREAVQITQPYIERFTDPALFRGPTSSALLRLKDGNPGLVDQLHNLVERSRTLYEEEALLPDTAGLTNLVIEEGGRLRMIDGQPVASDNPWLQGRIIDNLAELESALAVAA